MTRPVTPGLAGRAANVASRPRLGTATPKQSGPTRRMPWRRVMASRLALCFGSRPDVITTRDRTPRWPHCAATSSTWAAGTAITARSAGSGRSSGEARLGSPATWAARGFTTESRPRYPAALMLSRMARPTVPRRRLAPITATEVGAKMCRRLATSALLSRSATAPR